ncbi:MAG: FAD-dependent oxidoreductase [Syntrophomonadaceae bacterium]|jgi:2,4-dienoyl-CoA reductase-like NADH-dependent reductase (Old Yellow Enzyme family)/thioredoxin reductase|nr:FAD-dependent oxidoreductase [Syntrophomonadaceae bacterium]
MEHFPALFAPVQIGSLKLKNRIAMAPMLVGYAHQDGRVSQSVIDYYETRAQGGAGLIFVEAACVDSPAGLEGMGQLRVDEDTCVEGLARLAQAIKQHGAGAFIQLFHAGRQTKKSITGVQPVAPSPISCPMINEEPRQLDSREIKVIEEKFIKAAHYARSAGFDGVEIHAAHGYLINQFLSPHSNQRHDEYGGSLENRMRILMNIVKGIRNINPELAISVRINIDDFVPQGLKEDESIEICRHLEPAGASLIHCSCGTYESGLTSIEPASYQQGWKIYLAEAVKKAVSIPVIGGGMVSSPQFASQLLEEGRCDLIFLGRTLLADPHWPNKARQGELADIRPCIRCNQCISSNFKGMPVSCTVNPHTGREKQFQWTTKPVPKYRSAVIGSGPAGLQAAISLSRLGLEVTLFEKEIQGGGLMNLAGMPPHKQRILDLRDYMLGQLKQSKVEQVYSYEFRPEDVDRLKPDFIVMATGSVPVIPDIEGIEPKGHLSLEEILTGKVCPRSQHLLVIGGGENGCETADFLAQAGNKVTIIEAGRILAPGMEKKNRRDLMNRLQTRGVVRKTSSQVIKIDKNRVWIAREQESPEIIEADAIVLAVGYKPYHPLYKDLKQLGDNLYIIGDALRVRGFKSAILEAELTVSMIARQKLGI